MPFLWQDGFCMTTDIVNPQSTMQKVLETFPGAQRALFRRYHIGGGRSCGLPPTQTPEQLCRPNKHRNISEGIEHTSNRHPPDQKKYFPPPALARLREQNPSHPP